MQLSHVKELEQKYILGTYARYDVLIERGSGAYLVDAANKRYLDLLAGIGVNALGYNHPRVKQVLRKQIKRPLHISNLFYHAYQGRLAEKLCKLSGLDRAFFTNSGAESIAACLKFSRAYAGRAATNGSSKKYRILAMDNAFHGRTLGRCLPLRARNIASHSNRWCQGSSLSRPTTLPIWKRSSPRTSARC